MKLFQEVINSQLLKPAENLSTLALLNTEKGDVNTGKNHEQDGGLPGLPHLDVGSSPPKTGFPKTGFGASKKDDVSDPSVTEQEVLAISKIDAQQHEQTNGSTLNTHRPFSTLKTNAGQLLRPPSQSAPQLISRSSHLLTIKWNPWTIPSDAGTIDEGTAIEYGLEWREGGSTNAGPWNFVPVVLKTCEATKRNLKPATQYSFRIRARMVAFSNHG